MKKTLALLLLFSLQGFTSGLTWMTENYPPFNFERNGETVGIASDLLMEMFKITGDSYSRADLKVLPWAPSYTRVQKANNHILFSMTLTDKRKPIFKWVGPITESSNYILALKSAGLKINGPEDLNKIKIGTVRGDVGQELVLGLGVSEQAVVSLPTAEDVCKALYSGQVQAMAYVLQTAQFVCSREGHDAGQIENVYKLNSGEVYFAFNKQIDDSVIKKYQDAMDKVKSTPKYQEILDRYK